MLQEPGQLFLHRGVLDQAPVRLWQKSDQEIDITVWPEICPQDGPEELQIGHLPACAEISQASLARLVQTEPRNDVRLPSSTTDH